MKGSKIKNYTIIRNLLKGFVSLLNIFAVYPNTTFKPTQHMSDSDALSSDWKAIGNDFKNSMHKF